MQQEANGQLRDAVTSYREALGKGEVVAALLGLERVCAQIGWNDSLAVVADSAVRQHPAEPTARTVQLRVLYALKREADARAAFRTWVGAAPGEIEPYRVWSRLLLADGRTMVVDSVLQDAQRTLGATRGLTLEVAQLRASLGQWDRAAMAWRELVLQQDYMVSAAVYLAARGAGRSAAS